MGRPSKEAQEVLAWDSCPPRDMAVPKEHRAPDLDLSFLQLVHKMALQVGKYDMCFQGCTIICLQEAAGAYIVGLMEDENLCTIHSKLGYNYAQGHSVSLLHPGGASTVLRSSQEICFRVSVGCRLCGVFVWYWGWEVRVGYTVKLYRVLFFPM